MINRRCSKCDEEKLLDAKHFYVSKYNSSGFYKHCRVCADATTNAWNKKNAEKRAKMNSNYRANNKEKIWAGHIRRCHNTTSEQYYKRLAEQNGLCAVCFRPPIQGEKLRIDHNHKCCPDSKKSCGKCVRGLIHHKCNAALGMLNDDPVTFRLAAQYLEK